ncbi:MAG: cysteine protease StiP domain-containing protein [Pseudomonadota bacterium]
MILSQTSRLAAPPPFHGSYAAGDVTLLLQPLSLQPIDDLAEKERLIQSGERHYSEMISPERPPSPAYLALFHQAVADHAPRMARDLVHLARRIRAVRPDGVTLVSLARAGTPVGVLLRRLLAELLAVDAPHYSISVIRDRGVDAQALDHILARHPAHSLVFIDGWTAKGAITTTLSSSLAAYGHRRGIQVAPELFVLSDLAGRASGCGSTDDYLIPSALLNASVSGLVSRSILNDQIEPGQFHGCLFYADWQAHDLSRWFVDRLLAEVRPNRQTWLSEALPTIDAAGARLRCDTMVHTLCKRHGLATAHFVKPGIGEATRALLRRTPSLLLVRNPASAEVRHLVQLAQERAVPIEADPALALQAVALIRSLSDG